MAGVKHTCFFCGREGVKGFYRLDSGTWVCESLAACERRERGTCRRGVTTSYLVRSSRA